MNPPFSVALDDVPYFWDAIPRFRARVDATTTPDGCWPWKGKLCYKYGHFYLQPRRFPRDPAFPRVMYAHRFAFLLDSGYLPPDLFVLHRCNNTACCNPAHLYLGDQAQNVRDAVEAGHFPRGDQHYTALHPEKSRKGEQCATAIVNTEIVLRMRYAHDVLDVSAYALAKQYGIDHVTAWGIIKRKRWTHLPVGMLPQTLPERPSHPQKPRGHTTPDDVREIRRLADGGLMSYSDIAQKFDITYHTAWMIAKRRQRKGVD